MLILCYPRCTTCQKALLWLDEHHIPYEKRDIKEDNPTKEELLNWLDLSGLPIKRFFNTSGIQYRALNLKDKLGSMSEEDCLNLLATDGMLVKRPLVIGSTFVLCGFKEREWEQHLLNIIN